MLPQQSLRSLHGREYSISLVVGQRHTQLTALSMSARLHRVPVAMADGSRGRFQGVGGSVLALCSVVLELF